MADQNETPATDEKPEKKAQFSLQRIYVKDISFEAPGTPQSFNGDWQPETKVQFSSAAKRLAEHQFEVVLTINVTATNSEKVVFVVEIKQAGIFWLNIPEQALEATLAAQCPAILFPYARETVSDLVTRGTFPQFLLQPINFDAVYAESKRRQQQVATEAAAATRN